MTVTSASQRPAATAITTRVPDWRLLFAALCAIWGFSFLLIKLGTSAYPPMQVSLGRMVFGALVLIAAVIFRRQSLPRQLSTWLHLSVSAFFLNSLPYTLFAYAELHISSSLAGICNATSPLWSMLIGAIALREDRPDLRRVTALGIGFIGVLTVLGVWQGFAGQDLLGSAMALGAAASYSIGWAYVRRFLRNSNSSHLSITATQLLIGTAQLLIAASVFTSVPSTFSLGPLLAIFALGALGTGLAIFIQYQLVDQVGPTVGQTVTYFVPVIATFAGITLLNEHLNWQTPLGAAIILIGAALLQKSKNRVALK